MRKINVPLILFLIIIAISIIIFISHPLISCILLFCGSMYYRKKNNKYGKVYEDDYFTNTEKYKFDNTILGYLISAIVAVILSFTTIFSKGSIFVLLAWIIYLLYMFSCIGDCIRNKRSNKTQEKNIKAGGFSSYKEYNDACKRKNKQENTKKVDDDIKEISKFYESCEHCYMMSTDNENVHLILRLAIGHENIRMYNIPSKICYTSVTKEESKIRTEIEKLQSSMEKHYGLNNQWKEKYDPTYIYDSYNNSVKY